MTPQSLVDIALSLPGTVEADHFGKRDFRVGGKIFMTLPADHEAVFGFSPDQQAMMIALYPGQLSPVAGAWGLKGWTRLAIPTVDHAAASHMVEAAWSRLAPKKLKVQRDGKA